MAKDQLVPLGYAPVFKNGKGGLVVDTDSLRRGGAPRRDRADGDFDGEDDDDFDGEDDDDFDGEDDDFDGEDDDDFDGAEDDDSEDDGDEDSDDDNTDDEEDFEMSDDFGRRKRRNKNNGSGRGGRSGRGQREPVLRRNQDRDGDGQRDGGLMQRRRTKKGKEQEWVGTIVGDTETLTGAGTATVRVVLQHDFIADELNFTGSRSDAKVTSVVFGERTIFNNSKGIAVGAFTSTTRSKGTIAGQYLRAGLTISVSGSLGGAGDFAVAIPGQKPLVC